MFKKFGNYQVQVGEIYSTTEEYKVLIDVLLGGKKEILSLQITWKTLRFIASSSAVFEFRNSEQFYCDLLQITKNIQSKLYLKNKSNLWWEILLSPLEGEYIYLGKLDGIDISISKKDEKKCEIGDDTFLPTKVLFGLIRRMSKER